jgi:hypothetical protein
MHTNKSMKGPGIKTILILFATACINTCVFGQNTMDEQPGKYKPDSQELYDTIVRLDSIFFEAYNTCKMDVQAFYYSDSIEFYHDQGGLQTSKQGILDGTRRNICGKVTRELVKGSIEVYPIRGYGAIEMGLHRFHNSAEKGGTPSHAGKFIIIWHHKNNQWEISRVVSLH